MKLFKLKNFIKGWIIGDFTPAIIQTKNFEVGIKKYKKGDKEKKHLHKKADEITVIVSGKYKMDDAIYKKGDIIWIEPNDATDFHCLESGHTTVIKIPSVKGDKYIVE